MSAPPPRIDAPRARRRAWPWVPLICLTGLPGCTHTDVTFCRVESCADVLTAEINNATQSVHTAIYALTNDAVIDAFAAAAARPGMDVQLVAEESQTDARVLAELANAGVQARFATPRSCDCGNVSQGIMHHKFTLIDGRTVVTGSYNYSCSAENCSEEHVVTIADPRVAEQFEAEFQHLFSTGEAP